MKKKKEKDAINIMSEALKRALKDQDKGSRKYLKTFEKMNKETFCLDNFDICQFYGVD